MVNVITVNNINYVLFGNYSYSDIKLYTVSASYSCIGGCTSCYYTYYINSTTHMCDKNSSYIPIPITIPPNYTYNSTTLNTTGTTNITNSTNPINTTGGINTTNATNATTNTSTNFTSNTTLNTTNTTNSTIAPQFNSTTNNSIFSSVNFS